MPRVNPSIYDRISGEATEEAATFWLQPETPDKKTKAADKKGSTGKGKTAPGVSRTAEDPKDKELRKLGNQKQLESAAKTGKVPRLNTGSTTITAKPPAAKPPAAQNVLQKTGSKNLQKMDMNLNLQPDPAETAAATPSSSPWRPMSDLYTKEPYGSVGTFAQGQPGGSSGIPTSAATMGVSSKILDDRVAAAAHEAATTPDPIKADNAAKQTIEAATTSAAIDTPSPDTLDEAKVILKNPENIEKIKATPEDKWDDAAKLAIALAPALTVLAGYALGGRTGALIGGQAMFEGIKVYGEVKEKEKLSALKKGGISGGKIVSYAGDDGKTYLAKLSEDSSGKTKFEKILDPETKKPIPDGKADQLALKTEEHKFITDLVGVKGQESRVNKELDFANAEARAQAKQQRDALVADKKQEYQIELKKIDDRADLNKEQKAQEGRMALERLRSGNDITEEEIKAGNRANLKKTVPGVNPAGRGANADRVLSRGENLPLPIKTQVTVLSTKLGKQKGFANDLSAAYDQLQDLYKKGKMNEFGVAGNGMLKMLNSAENPDAIGAQEEKRIGSLLQNISTPLSPSGEWRAGKDYEGFINQVKNKMNMQKSSASKTEKSINELVKPYEKKSEAPAAAAQPAAGDTIRVKTLKPEGTEVTANGAIYVIQKDGHTGVRKK